MSEEIKGYAPTEDGGWEPIIQPKGYIYTMAFILCAQCRYPVSSIGGPRYGSLCLSCYEKKTK